MDRVITAELLDHLPADDPAAMQSRRDLLRVHRMMATRSIVRGAWQALVSPRRAAQALRILDLGAGDGRLLLGVAQALAPRWPRVQLTLLDQQDLVSPATLQQYAALGWAVQVQTGDVLAWADAPADRPPARDTASVHVQEASAASAHWDLVSTALFLHHFAAAPLGRVLAAVAARCDRFFAFEPERDWLALAGSRLVGLLGANAVTRNDAVASVRAGFQGHELSAHWPAGAGAWTLREGQAGPFGHRFSAVRTAVLA